MQAIPEEARRGEPVELRLTLRNGGVAPAAAVLRWPSAIRRVQVFDAEGRDVTFSGVCGFGASSSRDAHLFVIAPAGEAATRLSWTHLATTTPEHERAREARGPSADDEHVRDRLHEILSRCSRAPWTRPASGESAG